MISMTKLSPAALLLASGGISVSAAAHEHAVGGFVPLFDGSTLGTWVIDDEQYSDHFTVRDGVLHIAGEGGWLRSSKQYGDFTLRLSFRYLTEDPGWGRVGVSGVFVRTPATSTYGSGWPDNSLEVQLANRQGGRPAIPGDARWGGAVLRHGNNGGPTSFDTQAALLSYGQTGEWQQLEIQAVGDAIHVTLNGRYLGAASAGGSAEGYIGLQAETGAIEFRNIEINEGSTGFDEPALSDEGFVPIFDGLTLNGWVLENPDSKGFEVRDGAIAVHGRQADGDAVAETCSGQLWSEKAYGDFILRYEARFQTNASVGGFFIRASEEQQGIQGVWNQIETRGMEDKLLPWNGILMRGSSAPQGLTMFDYRAAELAYAAVWDVTKDWVSFEARAEGGRITTWVNGVLVGQAEDVRPLRGLLGLQCETETVEYRNIQVKELNEAM